MSLTQDVVAKKQFRCICLDADGVLLMPYTHPEEPFEQIKFLLDYFRKCGFLLVVTSFNPDAFAALERRGLAEYFAAFRVGSNAVWAHHDKSQFVESKYGDLSKAKQMQDILANELADHRLQPSEVILIDDDMRNCEDASLAGFPYIFVKDSYAGPQLCELFPTITPAPTGEDLAKIEFASRDAGIKKVRLTLQFLRVIEAAGKTNEALTTLGGIASTTGK